MSVLINPDKFVVPYAVTVDDGETFVFHIRDGRPKTKSLTCPYCNGAVSFVAEAEARAAHFRHHDRSACDEKAHHLRSTIHDDVVKAAIALLNGRHIAKDICKGQEGIVLPTGFAEAEKHTVIDGLRPYRPDITVNPADGENAAILELEVIWSHKPTPERLLAAAKAGRAVGVLDATRIERGYIQRLHDNQAFDLGEAIKDYICEERFSILSDRHVKRAISGILSERAYQKAAVLEEHRDARPGATYIDTRPQQIAPQGNPNDQANAVLEALRECGTEAEITATLARCEDCIDGLKSSAPVRVIHIKNLADCKRKSLAQAW